MYALLLLLLHDLQQTTFGTCNAKDALSGVLYRVHVHHFTEDDCRGITL